jgi:hypothetical protein
LPQRCRIDPLAAAVADEIAFVSVPRYRRMRMLDPALRAESRKRRAAAKTITGGCVDHCFVITATTFAHHRRRSVSRASWIRKAAQRRATT